jgi:hypothetical protein
MVIAVEKHLAVFLRADAGIGRYDDRFLFAEFHKPSPFKSKGNAATNRWPPQTRYLLVVAAEDQGGRPTVIVLCAAGVIVASVGARASGVFIIAAIATAWQPDYRSRIHLETFSFALVVP